MSIFYTYLLSGAIIGVTFIVIFYYMLSYSGGTRKGRAEDFGIFDVVTGLSSKELDDGILVSIIGVRDCSKITIPKGNVIGDIVPLFNKDDKCHYYTIIDIDQISTVNLLINYKVYYFKYSYSESVFEN